MPDTEASREFNTEQFIGGADALDLCSATGRREAIAGLIIINDTSVAQAIMQVGSTFMRRGGRW